MRTSLVYRSLCLCIVFVTMPVLPASASLYYDLEIAGQTGGALGLVAIETSGISINNNGRIAFTGDADSGLGFEGVYVQDPGGSPSLISFSAVSRTFGPGLELNDSGQVIVRDSISGDSLVRLWDSNAAGSFTTLDSTIATPSLNALGFWPAVNNSGAGAWGGFNANNFLFVPPPTPEIAVGSVFSTRPAIASDGTVVARIGMTGTSADPIVIVGPTGSMTTIGPPTWTELGRSPGISQDGDIVVWAGDRGNGRGIFARDMSTGNIFRVAGENGGVTPCTTTMKRPVFACDTNPDLGYDSFGNELYLTFSATDIDARIGVALQEPAGSGLVAGNSFVVLYQGTPNAPSADNPAIAGTQPLLFSSQNGIFTTRVDVDADLLMPSNTVIHELSALPVVQIGDSLPVNGTSITVSTLAILDSLANVELDAMGSPRTPNAGDHQVAFFVNDGLTSYIVRAVFLDTDADGLLDHWETDGIDVDQDGVGDLDLAAMGADPSVRDLFLEIDWLANNGTVSYRPVQAAIDSAVALFASAPTGAITLHVDAGSKLSRNMGSNPALLQGGDVISDPAGHIGFIHFGAPGSVPSVPPNVVRSFQALKDPRFGTADKRAREFAFRYAIFGDVGGVPGNTNGGLGEVAFYSDNQSVPGNDLLIAQRGNARPPPFPNGFIQFQTLAHELGHTLGLRHGGSDHNTTLPPLSLAHNAARYKPDYLSLMNYSHTLGLPGRAASSTPTSVQVLAPTTYTGINGLANFAGLNVLNVEGATPGAGDLRTLSSNTNNQLVVSSSWTTNPVVGDTPTVLRDRFSDSADSVFDDWSALELGFGKSLDSIGITAIADRAPPTGDAREPEPDANEVVLFYGPADTELPEIIIVSPTTVAPVGSSGSTFLVSSAVTDDFGVSGVVVSFDTDNDGTISPTEAIPATLESNGRWEVTLGPIVGPDGIRTLSVVADDVSGRFNEEAILVTVPEPGAVLLLTSGASLLALLGRRRAACS